MKPLVYKIRNNGDIVICDNPRDHRKIIDGVEYLLVKGKSNSRTFLVRKDALERVLNAKY